MLGELELLSAEPRTTPTTTRAAPTAAQPAQARWVRSQRRQPEPPAAPKTVCGSPGQAGGGPGACMVRQSLGPADAAWVVRASGFEPGKPVTVALTFNSPPQVQPPQKFTRTVRVTPSAGTFQLTINRLFPGAVQLGIFDVHLTGPGGRDATTSFIVIPPGGP